MHISHGQGILGTTLLRIQTHQTLVKKKTQDNKNVCENSDIYNV